MKTVRFLAVFFVLVFVFAWSEISFSEQKTITLPKGTTVEKMGPGHFKFKLPDGQIVEVKDLNPSTGSLSYVSLVAPIPLQKTVVSGKQGKLITTKKITKEKAKQLPASDYIMIDDDIAWLPATLIFQPAGVVDPEPPHKPRGLSPQPDPPGKR